MAVVSIEKIGPDVVLGLWRIEGQEDSRHLLDNNPSLEKLVLSCGSSQRRAEIIAVYSLLYAMTGDSTLFIDHTPEGRPFVRDSDIKISLSHTKGYATVIMSHTKAVAVDIEYMSNRVDRIAGRFIRDDESAPDTLHRLLHWCAKETLFKYCLEYKLGYYDMRLHPLEISENGVARIDNLINMTSSDVYYRICDDYVLTYIF